MSAHTKEREGEDADYRWNEKLSQITYKTLFTLQVKKSYMISYRGET